MEEFFAVWLRWEFVHDGQNSPADRFSFPSNEVKTFTRRYRNGNREAVFFYDLRGTPSVKFEFYPHAARKDTFSLDKQHGKGRRDIFNLKEQGVK